MTIKLVSITQGVNPAANAQELISYTARVSNPDNQLNFDTAAKLLAYCIKNNHWSIFEMVDMTLEVTTSRAIAAQILRHRSFNFQEFSQRYAEVNTYVKAKARRQDVKNRQNSIDDIKEDDLAWFYFIQEKIWDLSYSYYKMALQKNIARETARFILPLNTETRLYMKGSLRSWIHYIQVRTDISTQLEHREIALAAKTIFCEQFPDVAKALEWT